MHTGYAHKKKTMTRFKDLVSGNLALIGRLDNFSFSARNSLSSYSGQFKGKSQPLEGFAAFQAKCQDVSVEAADSSLLLINHMLGASNRLISLHHPGGKGPSLGEGPR